MPSIIEEEEVQTPAPGQRTDRLGHAIYKGNGKQIKVTFRDEIEEEGDQVVISTRAQ